MTTQLASRPTTTPSTGERTHLGTDLAELFGQDQAINVAELQPGVTVILKDPHRPAQYGEFVEAGEMDLAGQAVPTLRVDFGGPGLGTIPVRDGLMLPHVRIDFGS